ncbi:putative Ig domain-containing protein [Candidatus Marinimicrobia bacterium]|nr:putative Ig domain-containing protein [Candidatus Neomarinimicrobiota bacterium]
MKNIYLLSVLLLLIVVSCEDVEVAYPGNNQTTSPVSPVGTAEWLGDFSGELPENTAPGVSIATLNAEDGNPDDEFSTESSYTIASQKIDGINVDYFTIETGEDGVSKLVTNRSIDYESLSGSKTVDLSITVEDDSPQELTSNFNLSVAIINVNESPYYSNLNSITPYADEYVEYSFNKLNWSDIDEGDNPSLTNSGPSWLDISNEGLFQGTPSSTDVGINSYLLTLTDGGGLSVDEEVDIEVRPNIAPVFDNAPSALTIKVGCYDANDNIVDVNWRDPNNSSAYFAGNDLVTFEIEENVSWLGVDEQGLFYCISAPSNSDAAVSTINMTLTDDRPSNSLSTDASFDLEVLVNDAPTFTNLSDFPSAMDADSTEVFELEWFDPDGDLVSFQLKFSLDDNHFSHTQLSWVELDNSGNITLEPQSGNAGDWSIEFIISDDCYEVSEEKAFTIRN